MTCEACSNYRWLVPLRVARSLQPIGCRRFPARFGATGRGRSGFPCEPLAVSARPVSSDKLVAMSEIEWNFAMDEVGYSPYAPEPTRGEFRQFIDMNGPNFLEDYFASAGGFRFASAAFWFWVGPLMRPKENWMGKELWPGEGSPHWLLLKPMQRCALLQLWFLSEWIEKDDILSLIRERTLEWHPYVHAPDVREDMLVEPARTFISVTERMTEEAQTKAFMQLGPVYACSEASAGGSSGVIDISDEEAQEAEPAASNEPVATAQEAELESSS